MVHRGLLIIIALLVLFTCSAVVFADDDPSGNINVELTRIDEGVSYTFIIALGIMVVLALIVSLAILIKGRSSSKTRHPKSIDLKKEYEPSFKKEGYYTEVFQETKPEEVSDEKSEPVQFIRVENRAGVERYLKEDERIVTNVLRMKNNSCSQATLRVVTDFSKAKLSRILAELEERGVIYKEQQGRKNLITLKT